MCIIGTVLERFNSPPAKRSLMTNINPISELDFKSLAFVGGGNYDTLVVHGINLQYLYGSILFHG
jgi:hypothetical protein